MTFIASVIANKGVAVIADSLVTSEMPILQYGNFIKYINGQPKNPDGETTVNTKEIIELFYSQPVYTRDYEEKLFKLNHFTAVTTTGAAYINNKNISTLIEEYKGVTADLEDFSISFNEKLEQFKFYLNNVVKEHLTKYETIGYCVFIISHYEVSTHRTHIVRATINETDNTKLHIADYDYVTLVFEHDWIKVICDGQNKISHNILYGFGRYLFDIGGDVINNILDELKIDKSLIAPNFIENVMSNPFFSNLLIKDLELLNLTNLSMQQAVDLASLLMRIEVDFQKYTKNIPTVGGVIKLAVIDEHGFRFIAGDKIETPKHIHL